MAIAPTSPPIVRRSSNTVVVSVVVLLVCTLPLNFVAGSALPRSQSQSQSNRPKVFGVGLSFTGNDGLAEALGQINYTSILLHDNALHSYLYPDDGRRIRFTDRYSGNDAVLDLPTALHYASLAEQFPRAKFVLTVRSPDSWVRSLKKHILQLRRRHGGLLPFRIRRLLEQAFGTSEDNREVWVEHYLRHMVNVQSIIPPNQLLVLNFTRGDGWPELCRFLRLYDGPCDTVLRPTSAPFPRARGSFPLSAVPVQHVAPLGVNATSRFAYAVLLFNPSTAKGREYLLGALVAAASLRNAGSEYDIVFMIMGEFSDADANMLRLHAIKTVRVEPVNGTLAHNPEKFDEKYSAIYRAKARVLQLVEYEAVIFIDCDVVFHDNPDLMFETDLEFLGRRGYFAPLNTGFFLVKPSLQSTVDMCDIAASMAFNTTTGWLDYGPIRNWSPMNSDYPNPKNDWTFWGASVDQGLFYYYFACIKPNGTWIGRSREWDDMLTHFAGNLKPTNFIGNISVLNDRYRDPAIQWLRLYGAIRKELALLQQTKDDFDPCMYFPCDLSRSTCQSAGTSYTCVCTGHHIDVSASLRNISTMNGGGIGVAQAILNGSHCKAYIAVMPAERHAELWSGGQGVETVVAATEADCHKACMAFTKTTCPVFSYNHEQQQCMIHRHPPQRLKASKLGYAIFVIESSGTFEPVFAEQTRVFSSAVHFQSSVFVMNYVRTVQACQAFCDANPACRGFVYWHAGSRICLGLRDLGNDRGADVNDLAEALSIEEWSRHPVCFRKLV